MLKQKTAKAVSLAKKTRKTLYYIGSVITTGVVNSNTNKNDFKVINYLNNANFKIY